MADNEDLRAVWTNMFSKSLPSAACAHDPAQSKWPVHVDHCFGRIILDNVVGEAKRPWMKALKAPAVKTMDEDQLKGCIALGQKILDGRVDLVELDRISLSVRGKTDRKYKGDTNSKGKQSDANPRTDRKRKAETVENDTESKKAKSGKVQSELPFKSTQSHKALPKTELDVSMFKKEHEDLLQKIASESNLTAYRKRLYSTLLSVPEGRYTTYAAMSDYLQSSARAVGNGMRNNPFAPNVPCHRVLSADGSIGGFGGDWGKDGKHAMKKVDLLRDEGVKFDSKGKVIGPPFRDFKDLSS